MGVGGTAGVCQGSATQCSSNGLQACTNGQWSVVTACSTGLVCERYAPATCGNPKWAEWPVPNSQVDVNAGAPNLEGYVDNGDSTVTDTVTGLMWQQLVQATTYSWVQALSYCPTLTLVGYSDWRLPSVIELESIVDLGQPSPSINGTYFPSTPPKYFWSATQDASSPSQAWFVDFRTGTTYFSGVSGSNPIRCVR